MVRLLRPRHVLWLVGALLVASRSAGAEPSPSDAIVPCGITLVGSTAGVADPRGEFHIVIFDLAHNPVAGADVAIDFTGCTPDIRVASIQSGATVQCTAGGPIVHATTDAMGTVRLRLLGGASNGTAGAGFRCGRVYADGVLLSSINIAAFDENGVGGLNPADLALWLVDAFSGIPLGRSDYNCSDSINAADLSLLLQASLGGGSTQSATGYCQ